MTTMSRESRVVYWRHRQTITEADVLRRAADLLEEFGWCQHQIAADENGELVPLGSSRIRSYCMGGAIDQATIDLKWELEHVADQRFWSYWSEIVGYHIPLWNDHPERTREEVVSLLRDRADELDAEEREMAGWKSAA